jgi:tetratricopeptide (TPR) repeat protein/predicted Ser/Thr protein kinase
MQCPVCQTDNPPTAVTCAKCSTPFPLSKVTLAPTGVGTEAWSVAVTQSTAVETATKEQLQPGTIIGDRYEILQLLGQGGMGAVYKARDIELERLVALKLIRPDLASHPEILRRFKQELILAREVTHRNVVRIFDLGQAHGIRFITMEYVEGRDLRALLHEKGKLTAQEAVPIFLQIAAALEAAHHAGVVHRDLKPQNIMVDQGGRVYVMDFGVARSLETPGMTQTGALMGTPEYMSPEQAKGQKVDARSDLFSLGIIFYEMLSGVSPFKAETAMATMFKRMKERAVPLAQLGGGVPGFLSDVVSKCLEIDTEQRYQSAREIIEDLERWKADVAKGAMNPVARWLKFAPPIQKRLAAGMAAALLLVAAYPLLSKLPRWFSPTPKVAHAPVSVLVADFTNHTGDPIFDDTLEPMFNVALEGASFVNAYSRGSARKLAQQLPNPTDKLDEESARLVAVSQGLAAVITGSLSRRGDGYKLSVEALDARTGNSIATSEINASNKDELLLDVPKLVAPIRKALGDSTPESAQITAAAGAYQAASLEAVHQFGVANKQQYAGKMQDALQSFSKAAELDPNFARAYAGIASTARNLGRQQDFEKYIKLAMEHVDRMTERERYGIRGLYYLGTGNWQKCVEEYSEMVKQYPADVLGHNNLSICYESQHNTPKAIEELQRALEISPHNQILRVNLALYLSYTGDFPAAEREARTVLQANPSYGTGYVGLAYAQVGQGQLAQAIETYRQLEKISNLGESLAAPGLADIALYEGRLGEAAQLLERGAAGDVQAGRLDSAAADFALLGYTQLLRKQKAAALAALEKALANSKSVSPRFLAARVYAAAGETTQARKLAAGLASEAELDPQAYAKLIEGEALLQRGTARQAIPLFTQANNQLDTWIGHFDLGRAYLEAGAFAEADSEFDRCLKRRGETFDLFDYVTNYGYLPEVYYYQGRVREGLKSPGAADSYRTYLSIRGKAGEDPFLPEVRRRLGQ